MKKFLLLLFLSSVIFTGNAQVLYNKIVGDSLTNLNFNKAISTTDGGFVLCGYKHISSSNSAVGLGTMVKLNATGDTSWTLILNDTGCFSSVSELHGQTGFIVCGYFGNPTNLNSLCRSFMQS